MPAVRPTLLSHFFYTKDYLILRYIKDFWFLPVYT